MDSNETQKPKRKAKSVDRAVIAHDTKLKLDGFRGQIAAQLGEFIKLNYTDLVNLLFALHPDDLTVEEIDYIRRNKYDEGRFIRWAHQEYVAAKARGEHVTLEELMERQKRLTLSTTPKKSKRGRKRKQSHITEDKSQSELSPEQFDFSL